MIKKILFFILFIISIFFIYVGYRAYVNYATYSDKLILKLSPFHDEIEIEGCKSSPDTWIVEEVNNDEYEWLIGSPIFCNNNKPQFKYITDTIIVEGYLYKYNYYSESEEDEYAVFFDKKVRFLREK